MNKLAVIFPGQGAQTVGMGKELLANNLWGRMFFAKASAVLGYDLQKLTLEGPADLLTASDHAQPAIFTLSAALYELWKQRCTYPVAAVAGLSSGEWSALYVAGVLSLTDTLKVLEKRGKFMQEACQAVPGTMSSIIGLELASLRQVCADANVEIANLNAPGQTVISGRVANITQAEELAKKAGARLVVRLNVAGAFHSSLMQPAADKLQSFLQDLPLSPPQIPVISNVTAQPHTSVDKIKELMVAQITGSVRWSETITYLRQQGINRYVECGPGKVLTGLLKRIDKEALFHNIHDICSLEALPPFLTPQEKQ